MLPELHEALRSELDGLAARQRLRACPELDVGERAGRRLRGRAVVSFCSNDYLGLASHAALADAAARAAAQTGFGAGASRLVAGDLPPHRQLEAALVAFLDVPALRAALLFPTGYHANLGLLGALAGREDLIVSDAANHASLIDGCRLSRAQVAVYPHLDAAAASAALANEAARRCRRRFLVTESLFSMDGDVAPLADLAEVAARHRAALLVDEAHALGVLGPHGRGLAAAAGVTPDAIVGTLGKAFGAFGGFVASTPELRALLVNRARTFIFTTAPPPPLAAAARAGLELASGPEGDARRERLLAHRDALTRSVRERLPAGSSPARRPPAGAIFPFVVGSDADALAASERLLARGLFVQAIRPPTVPEGTARLRVTLSAGHTADEVAALADALAQVLAEAPAQGLPASSLP